jgi:tetratricopeptide (TPR) repeat protein
MLSMIAAVLTMTEAKAAESIVGGGVAQSCYLAAESNFRPSESIQTCTFALTEALTDEDRAATYINRGILKLAKMDANGSLADFNRGLAMRAGMAEGYVDRGASLIMMHRYQDAVDDINKGITMNAKKLQVAYYDRGMANEGMGNLQAAYEDYKQAQTIDPDFTEPGLELKRFKVVVKPD